MLSNYKKVENGTRTFLKLKMKSVADMRIVYDQGTLEYGPEDPMLLFDDCRKI
jgi:hypothetical protein